MRLPFLYSYKLSGQVLDEVKDSKYQGVTISDNLDWSKHITCTTTTPRPMLGCHSSAEPEGLPTEVKGDSLLLDPWYAPLWTTLCSLYGTHTRSLTN